MAKYGLALLLLAEIAAAFWPLPEAVAVKNNLANWPNSPAARRLAETTMNRPAVVKKLIDQWGKLIGEKGETRNGLIQLAWLYWQIYDDETARIFWQRAVYLDPEFAASFPARPF